METGFFLRASDYLQNLSGVSARRGKQSEQAGVGTRQRLLDAARAEFGDKGIEAATTRGIAERAGCNEVTLFRHFESKQKLLGAVVQETAAEFINGCECGGSNSESLREALGHYARVYNDALERCEGMARAMIGESRRRPTLAKELIGDVLEPFHRRIAGYLDHCRQAGLIRADLNSLVLAEVFTSALMGGLLRRTSGLSELDRNGWLRETVEIFVRAIET